MSRLMSGRLKQSRIGFLWNTAEQINLDLGIVQIVKWQRKGGVSSQDSDKVIVSSTIVVAISIRHRHHGDRHRHGCNIRHRTAEKL